MHTAAIARRETVSRRRCLLAAHANGRPWRRYRQSDRSTCTRGRNETSLSQAAARTARCYVRDAGAGPSTETRLCHCNTRHRSLDHPSMSCSRHPRSSDGGRLRRDGSRRTHPRAEEPLEISQSIARSLDSSRGRRPWVEDRSTCLHRSQSSPLRRRRGEDGRPA